MVSSPEAVASEVEAFRASARSLLDGVTDTRRLRGLRDGSPAFERPVWRRLAEGGWPAILVPEALGGLGLGLPHAAAVVQEIGRALLPEPFVGAGVQSIAALCALPASDLRDRLVEQAIAGELVVGLAWQERAGELDAAAPATRSALDAAGTHRLGGTKQWVVPGEGADGWLVTSTGAEGLALHWVPAATPGLRCEAVRRIDGSTMATLVLQDAVVAPAHRLAHGEAVRHAVAQANDVARLMQSAELLGIARHAFDTTLDHLKTRQQFGRPIGANQALQHRMVDALLQLELASAGLAEALQADPDDAVSLAVAASRAKARCSHAALHIARLAVQFHGAMGYTDECDVGLYLKRAMHLSGWLGNAAAHRLRHARLVDALRDDGPPDAGLRLGTTAAPVEFPREADWAAMGDAEFRAIVRGFFQAHYPPQLRNLSRRVHWPEIRDWYLALSRQGWLAPAWPREHGGMALAPDKLMAFIEEQEDHGVARMPDQGLINLGPVLIRYGTPAQQAEWLPKIIAGEHVWCQGYSEPNAGSDLASLRTEAVPDGDDFIVNGQKIWTTLAQDASHIFLLVRTDRTAKKQEGISFLLVDLATPGVVVRPILNIAGEEEFCEVFFDDVRVPQANLVGQLNRGWHIAKALLGYERLFVGSPKTCQYALGQLRATAKARGLLGDAAFIARFAELQLDLADLRSLYAGFADLVKRGEALPPSVSMLKIWATETYTRIGIQLTETADEDGGSHASADATAPDALAPLMNALVTTIYGGTNEIQRNILSRQVLGLPV
ncbi:MAG: acyl-CoA dehydrogenase [Variovorax sp.]|nr:MAG: acyl-CoA dehydrogenase [Variovorax sp.]